MNRGDLGTAMGSALLAPSIFGLAGPSLIGLREQANDPISRQQLRTAQIVGSAFVLGIGIAAGMVFGNNRYVIIGSATGAFGMFALYEYALRTPKPTKDQQQEGQSQTVLYRIS